MSYSKKNRFFAGVLAATVAGIMLSGCDAKPGVAAYSKDWVVTEQELGQVSGELSQAFQINRSFILQMLVALNEGGRDALSNCPSWNDIPVKDLQLPQGAQLSELSKDVLKLSLCQGAADPAYAENAGLPVTDEATSKIIYEAFTKASADPDLVMSPRSQMGQIMSMQSQGM